MLFETAHPSTASVPVTVLLYNGPLLCGFNYYYYNEIVHVVQQNRKKEKKKLKTINRA